MTHVAVVERGPVDGPGVVLVHGIGVSHRYFRPLIDMLAATHRVIAPDLPGFGHSGRPRPALSVPEQADVVAAVIDRCGLERPLLLGHSMGTQVVTETALCRPGGTGPLVLVGPVVDPAAPTATGQALRLGHDTLREPPRLSGLVLAEYALAGPRSFFSTLPHMLAYPLLRRVAEVGVPVVVLRGEGDPIARRSFVDSVAASARSGTWQEVPRAGHLAMTSHPHAVAALCRRLTG